MIQSGCHQPRLVEATQDRAALMALLDQPRLHVLPMADPAKSLVQITVYPTPDLTNSVSISTDHMECQKGLIFPRSAQETPEASHLPITARIPK
jgi:hypothetical protein